jgi:type II secretory pathway component HofQ
MHSVFVRRGLPLVAIALAWTLLVSGASADPPKDGPKSAAAIKKALDQKITLDFQTQNFNEAVEHLKQKTKINFVLDNFVLQMMGINLGDFPMPINLKSENGKVRIALQSMLSQLHLTYVILGDTVLITTDEFAHVRQMRQRVNVDVTDMPLSTALKQLADETGTNLVIDPRQAAKAKNKITLQLDDVTLETAVRLLTEVADLNAVRVGNVLFITSDERADKIRKETPANPNPNPYDLLMPKVGLGGFMPAGGFGMGGGGIGKALPPIDLPPPPKKEEEKK